jgi:hypothetical protein
MAIDTMNILVIRSAALVFNQTLQSLKQEFPDSRITVLAPESMEESVRQTPLVDEVVPFRHPGRMTAFRLGSTQITQLKRQRFDLAVSLYNVDHGLGYANIDIIAWAVKARQTRGYNPQGRWVEHKGPAVFKKAIMEKTTLIWALLNVTATGILFFLITLGILGEWVLRKCFSFDSQAIEPTVKKSQSSQATVTPAKIASQV